MYLESITAFLRRVGIAIWGRGLVLDNESMRGFRSKLQALIIDHSDFLVKSFQLLLEDAGFKVDTASTGKEALEKASGTDFHLVISDADLPDISGSELSRCLKETCPGVSVVTLGSWAGIGGGAGRGTESMERLPKLVDSLSLFRVNASWKKNL